MEAGIREKIYVVGFPKSGNTWLTRLLADVLDSPAGQAMLKGDPEIAADFNEEILQRNSEPRFEVLKTHLLPAILEKEVDRNIARVVYVKRDLRDVLVSSFFYKYKVKASI